MRCANCGNELKAGSLYCDVCGHPVQIVPDYNEFDGYHKAQIKIVMLSSEPNKIPRIDDVRAVGTTA